MAKFLRDMTLSSGLTVCLNREESDLIHVNRKSISFDFYGYIKETAKKQFNATRVMDNDSERKLFKHVHDAVSWICEGVTPQDEMKPKSKTLTLRLDSDECVKLDAIMEAGRHKTASKAIIDLIMSNDERIQDFLEYQERAIIAESEVKRLNSVIENGRLSALAFADALSQDDFLSES